MTGSLLKRYGLYLLRWQLSTPILAAAVWFLNPWGSWVATSVANLVGGLVFFWIDRAIFSKGSDWALPFPLWQMAEGVSCKDCGADLAVGFRIVKAAKNYDRISDPSPEFRCWDCAQKKQVMMSLQGRISSPSSHHYLQ